MIRRFSISVWKTFLYHAVRQPAILTRVCIAGYLNRLRKKVRTPRTPRRNVSTTAFTGWRGHGSFGAVPERYASRSVCGHAVVARNPDSGSISANSIPSGGRSVKGPDPG